MTTEKYINKGKSTEGWSPREEGRKQKKSLVNMNTGQSLCYEQEES